jgi:hypothetical protein
MDIGRSFTFMFDDKDWLKKIAIGGLVTLVPILNFVSLGYALRVLRRVSDGQELPLPEWDDWGGDFIRGLLAAVAVFIYSLPGIVVILLGALIGAAADNELCIWIGYCPGILWVLLVAVVTPALYTIYARTGEFGSMFRFADIWALIRDNISDYLVALLLYVVASVVASIVGSIACGIGIVFTMFWSYLVMGHLFGQVGRTTTVLGPMGIES